MNGWLGEVLMIEGTSHKLIHVFDQASVLLHLNGSLIPNIMISFDQSGDKKMIFDI